MVPEGAPSMLLSPEAAPFFPELHSELTGTWRTPYLASVVGAEERGYSKLPSLEEAVAAHLCPPSALGVKAHAVHPSKPFSMTSALANRAYAVAGQAGSALHKMVVQCFRPNSSTAWVSLDQIPKPSKSCTQRLT